MVKMLPLACFCMVLTTACGGGNVPTCKALACPHPAGTYQFDGALQEIPDYVKNLQAEEVGTNAN